MIADVESRYGNRRVVVDASVTPRRNDLGTTLRERLCSVRAVDFIHGMLRINCIFVFEQ